MRRRRGVDRRHLVARAHREGPAVEFRQRGTAVDSGDRLHERPRQAIAGVRRPVGETRREAGQTAVAVGLRQLALGERHLAVLRLDRAVAQHQVREVEVELVRRHVRTLGHEAHVAQRAGVDDGLEVRAGDAVELARLRPVDQVEQPREAVAQVEAAAAAVTDVEDPPQLGVEFRRVVERFVAPVERMADRRIEAALAPAMRRARPGARHVRRHRQPPSSVVFRRGARSRRPTVRGGRARGPGHRNGTERQASGATGLRPSPAAPW
jgi:hypothetical protein